MTSPHVLQIIDGLNIGGAEILLRDLTDGLLRRGFQVSVAYGTPGPLMDQLTALGVQLVRIPRLLQVDPWQFAMLYRTVRRLAPAIVHTHLFKSDFHGRPAARFAGAPVVVSTLHSTDRWAKQWPLGWAYGVTARFADRVIAVSTDVQEFHIRYTGLDERKLVTIENGVDVGRFTNMESAGRLLRSKLNIPETAVLFGIIGRLTPPKDHKTFLQAASKILQRIPQARFVVIGDGPLRGELARFAIELGIHESVTFTGFRNDIPALLAAIDVLVISSKWEGLPVNLLEAMAASRPVVATSVGGVPLVVTQESAILVEPSDPDAIARAGIQLSDDPSLRQRMGRAGYERVLQSFSLDVMVDRTARLYAELLKARGLEQFIPPLVAERES